MKAKRHGTARILTEDLITLYVVGLKTMEEIGKIAGMTRAGVQNVLKQSGVEYKGGKVDRVCEYCGGAFKAARYLVKHGRANHCSIACYSADRSMGHDMSVSSRHGRAALMMAKVNILPGQVVHHIDGDRTNNNIENLRLFNSQREHLKFHHAHRQPKQG